MRKGEIAKNILLSIAAVGAITLVLALPGLPMIMKQLGRDPFAKQRLHRSIKTLKERKLIRVYRQNGKEVVEITEAGKKQILAYKIEELTIQKQKKWDGKWRVVIFDIPEKKARARRALSLKLRQMGFYPLQKSCFVSPFECQKELDFIGEYFEVRNCILYLEVSNIENESHLKKYFKLA